MDKTRELTIAQALLYLWLHHDIKFEIGVCHVEST